MSSDQTIQPSDSTLQGQYAGFISRMLALLVDVLLVIAGVVIVGLTTQLILRFFNLDDFFSNAITDLVDNYTAFESVLRGFTALGSFYFIFYLYYVILHTAAGGITVGKALMGLRVVRMNGVPLTFGRSTRRYLTFLLSALPLFLGLLWVIWDDRRQGWHDKLSDTCVIYDWPAQEDERFLSGLKNRLHYVQETRKRYGIGSDLEEDTQSTDEAVPSSENLT
jgi:uncharacterized RDD family membrane protein YckC